MEIHRTTIAEFISGNKEAAEETFVQVLAYCNELGLIGGLGLCAGRIETAVERVDRDERDGETVTETARGVPEDSGEAYGTARA
jgi:hypothetical protein